MQERGPGMTNYLLASKSPTEDLAWASASPKGDGYDVAVKDLV
jgi:hypothetical protein